MGVSYREELKRQQKRAAKKRGNVGAQGRAAWELSAARAAFWAEYGSIARRRYLKGSKTPQASQQEVMF